MDACYEFTYFWLFVKFFCGKPKVVGATSSEGFVSILWLRIDRLNCLSAIERMFRIYCRTVAI